jgi:hypothetical protein
MPACGFLRPPDHGLAKPALSLSLSRAQREEEGGAPLGGVPQQRRVGAVGQAGHVARPVRGRRRAAHRWAGSHSSGVLVRSGRLAM